MRSIRRNMRLITLIIAFFLAGMTVLVLKIYRESSFYIVNSSGAQLGKVYDRKGNVLFDQDAQPDTYGEDYFTDIANIIGNDSGQMTNTLVSENMQYLNNYSFSAGTKANDGQSAIYTTLDHDANRAVYDSFGGKNGAAIAYNYKTGEILVCVSRPGLNPFHGYSELEEGSLLNKAFYQFTPGSTQKIATLISAREMYGEALLESKQFECTGSFVNQNDQTIYCHNSWGHGIQNITQAFANSCNPFFAQLVQDEEFSLDASVEVLKRLGYSINGSKKYDLEINNMSVETASTVLNDKTEFSTQWGLIGQGETMISPCMIMMWQSAIASESGKAVLPFFIDHTTRLDGTPDNKAETVYSEQMFSAETASYVKNIMLSNGSRYWDTIPGYTVGLKSGTAQVKHGDEENAFLAGFDSDPDHPIAFCVLIEDRHSDDITADSIVHKILSLL